MNWFTWQQHKKQFMIMGIIFLIFAALIIPAELHLWPIVKEVSAECTKPNAAANCVQQKVTSFDSILFAIVALGSRFVLLAVPFVLGLFWGVPLIANEYINGTNKLVWTRGISRKRWLTVKLLWILVAAVLFAGAFAALSTWWSRVDSTLFLGDTSNPGTFGLNRFSKLAFDTQGIVPAAYALFAAALGAMFGAWFKQVLTALAVTCGVLLVVQLVIPSLVRPHYESPKMATMQLNDNDLDGGIVPIPAQLGLVWVVGGAIQNDAGQIMEFGNPPAGCRNALENGTTSQGVSCLRGMGYHWVVKYQPASRFWDFQGIETAVYVALSLVPIIVTYRLVLKRDA